MKRTFVLVGICLLAFIVVVSIAATTQKLTLQAFAKPGSGPVVAFNLPKAGRVTLEIYDVTGRKVTNLLENQYLEAGKHTYLWDAIDDQGRQVSNGIYFVSLRADNKHRCIKLTYFARSVIASSSRDVTPDDAIEITEEDIIGAELKIDDPSRAALEKYEQDARKLAKAIAMALPDIQPTLFDSIECAGDEVRHKVKLVSFTGPATGAILCNTRAIDEPELSRILNSYSDFLWIHVPVLVGGWTAAANPIDVVVVHPPYDEKELKVVYGYNRNGDELTFDPWIPPEYPVFAITHESPVPPIEETIPVEETPKETGKSKSQTTSYSCRVSIWRYWKHKWDSWPDYPPEFYARLWIKNPSTGKKKKLSRVNFYEVDEDCANNKCENCDCNDIPNQGNDGYYPGVRVGSTQGDYSRFNYLRAYDDDTWGDDKAEAFNLRDMAVPPSAWYPGELKQADCPGKDPYECWGVDLYLDFIPLYRLFSFTIIADPHIKVGASVEKQRLRAIIHEINNKRSTYNIKFVFVVGDITGYNDSPSNPADFDTAIAILNELDSSIEWFPLIGNHDIDYYGGAVDCDNANDQIFQNKFASQYNHLANSSLIENWRKQAGSANFSFEYYAGENYFHFLCLDWVARNGCGRCAAKLSFTYNFYYMDLQYYSNSSMFGTFLFAHHPCSRGCPDCISGWTHMGFCSESAHDECSPLDSEISTLHQQICLV